MSDTGHDGLNGRDDLTDINDFITNNTSGSSHEQNFTGPSTANKEEAAAKARQHGWVEPVAYNYAAYGYGNQIITAEGNTGEGPSTSTLPTFQWAHEASKYEWEGVDPANDAENVGAPHPKLEAELFKGEFHNVSGDLFADILKSDISTVGPKNGTCPEAVKSVGWENMDLHWLVKANLKLAGWTTPTPVQAAVIPIVTKGYDVVGIAQTGTGKTAAYLLPIISQLIPLSSKLCAPRPGVKGCKTLIVRAEPLVVIVCPTRELSFQLFDELRRWCYRTMFRPCVAYGGGPIGAQIRELQSGCDILVGTLGRIVDILNRPNVLSLSRVRYNVIDEADELLSADWETSLNRILLGGDAANDDTKFLMFSATFPRELRKVARKYLDEENHIRVRVGIMNMVADSATLQQEVIWVDKDLKNYALYDLLYENKPCRTMIFVNHKGKVDEVDDFLYNEGLPSTSLSADRTQLEREDAMRAFKSGICPILVTTDVSARGLDIRNVLRVVQYDLPDNLETYVHRIGRTARVGNRGTVTSFYNDYNANLAPYLVKLLVQSGAAVPDFLESFVEEVTTTGADGDGAVTWEDDDAWENLSDAADNEADFDDGAELAEPFGNFGVTDGAVDEAAGGFAAADEEVSGFNASSATAVVAGGW